jgi:hypothetical protein
LNVQQQRCENILKFGSQHFDQCDPELSWLVLFWYKSVWGNCHWLVHLPSESWYFETPKHLMYGWYIWPTRRDRFTVFYCKKCSTCFGPSLPIIRSSELYVQPYVL